MLIHKLQIRSESIASLQSDFNQSVYRDLSTLFDGRLYDEKTDRLIVNWDASVFYEHVEYSIYNSSLIERIYFF